MRFNAHPYQIRAAQFHYANPYSALFADPGTGKTAIMLMLLTVLKREGLLDPPILLTAPLRIATQVWPDEIAKWDQFNDISYRILHGKNKLDRANEIADVHLINNEGLLWANKTQILNRYRALIIDESSKFKSWSSQRTKILRAHMPHFTRRHALTGSPTPKSMLDLFAQMYLCDGGKSLGRYITHFRHHYFIDKGFGMYPDWQLRDGAEKMIYDRVSPYCWRLDGDELLSLPPLTINDIKIQSTKKQANTTKKLLESLDLSQPFRTLNGATEYQAARRLASGIDEAGEIIHSQKIDACKGIIEELQGKPALIGFYYRSEGDVLSKIFNAPRIDGRCSELKSRELVRKWNRKELPVLLIQPAAGGHGLNLQAGGNDIIWFSYTDNQDDYYQLNKRIFRQGVSGAVRIHRLIVTGSIEVAMLKRIDAKTNNQKAFLDAVRDLIEGRND